MLFYVCRFASVLSPFLSRSPRKIHTHTFFLTCCAFSFSVVPKKYWIFQFLFSFWCLFAIWFLSFHYYYRKKRLRNAMVFCFVYLVRETSFNFPWLVVLFFFFVRFVVVAVQKKYKYMNKFGLYLCIRH